MKSVHTDSYRTVTRALKDARERAGLTQQQVASRLRRPQSFVAKYESGERRLDVIEFMIIAEAVRVNPARLLARLMKRLSGRA
jgi:transcriptional regulator with XRE-family HTH domain